MQRRTTLNGPLQDKKKKKLRLKENMIIKKVCGWEDNCIAMNISLNTWPLFVIETKTRQPVSQTVINRITQYLSEVTSQKKSLQEQPVHWAETVLFFTTGLIYSEQLASQRRLSACASGNYRAASCTTAVKAKMQASLQRCEEEKELLEALFWETMQGGWEAAVTWNLTIARVLKNIWLSQ